MALTDKLTAIADAIRTKGSTTDKLTLDGMVTAIEDIPTGGDSGNLQLIGTAEFDLPSTREAGSIAYYVTNDAITELGEKMKASYTGGAGTSVCNNYMYSICLVTPSEDVGTSQYYINSSEQFQLYNVTDESFTILYASTYHKWNSAKQSIPAKTSEANGKGIIPMVSTGSWNSATITFTNLSVGFNNTMQLCVAGKYSISIYKMNDV